MSSFPQASKPLLFRLPLEVRLMIYRYAWKVDPKPHTIRSTRQLKISYLKQQLLAIGRLGAICQQMRTEAFDEYFHHAQAYLRWENYGSGSNSRHNHSYKELILSSPLLLAHLRHVSFYWADQSDHKKNEVSPMEAFYWLQCLKQLRTLEVVVTFPYMWDVSGCCLYEYRSKQVSMSLANLRGLEKATIKFGTEENHWYSSPEDQIAELHDNKGFLKFKREIESTATLPKDAEPPSQAIEEHLGCLNSRWIRHKSSRI